MKLGTYSTIDCPTGSDEHIATALDYLRAEFEKIGGRVRQINNAHELAPDGYPSFEIDYPEVVADIIDQIEIAEGDPDTDSDQLGELEVVADNWHNKANAIEEAYNKKFFRD